jgi:hypothetical protein
MEPVTVIDEVSTHTLVPSLPVPTCTHCDAWAALQVSISASSAARFIDVPSVETGTGQ